MPDSGAVHDNAAEAPPLLLGEFLPYRLSVASEVISRAFAHTYQTRFGLSIPEWRVMAVLGEASPQTTQAVIERTAMDRVRVSRAVIRLCDRGLIDRTAQPLDRRAHTLSLSSAGRAAYRQIVPLARQVQARLMGGLTEDEAAALERILLKLEATAAAAPA